ncbi:O-methyltransferase [Tomitella biformata]|uniref:O-methyltransferase n=1 Tax=Tomitella biformata TaxID=630403 RepID=UPI0006854AC4|nr:O-methyltransferase [Tomitella biformata]
MDSAAAVGGDSGLAAARERAGDLGVDAVAPSVGTALSMFARMLDARTIVEIGTGAGVSGLWLLRGMRSDGVLTTIDTEPEYQRAAKQAFVAAGIAPSRTRLINGRALEVLPRLADASYDLVFIDTAGVDHLSFLTEGVRLLRPGGVIVLNGVLANGAPPEAGRRDLAAVSARDALRAIAEDPTLIPVLLPLGGGLVCAAKA